MKLALTLALLWGGAAAARGQGWHALPLPDEPGLNARIQVAPDGAVYLGYFDGGAARVRRWTGAAWEDLGSPSCGASWQSGLCFDGAAEPLYLSRDYGAPGAFNVRWLVGGAWQALTACSADVAYKPTLVASIHDPAGAVVLGSGRPGPGFVGPPRGSTPWAPTAAVATPIVLVNDGVPPSDPSYPSTPPELQDEYATVVYWREGDWRYLGRRRFSEFPSAYLDLEVWAGEIWVGYAESVGGSRFTLKRYDGASDSWPTVATLAGFPTKNTALCAAFGALFVVTNAGGELRAYALDGGQLSQVGGAVEIDVHLGQQDWIQRVSCGTDAAGRLYVACRRTDGRFAIDRLRSDPQGNLVWGSFADSPLALGDVRFVSMDVSAWEDRVYVAYTDAADRVRTGYYEIRD